MGGDMTAEEALTNAYERLLDAIERARLVRDKREYGGTKQAANGKLCGLLEAADIVSRAIERAS